jgi:tetratricopeptide (TPR) repeat protein
MTLKTRPLCCAALWLCLGYLLLLLSGCSIPAAAGKKDSRVQGSGESGVILAMRGGRAVMVAEPKSEKEPGADLPLPELRFSWSSYQKPPRYELPRAGQRHFFGFKITPDYSAATRAFLAGDGETALKYLDRVERERGKDRILAWRISYERVMILIMMGRPDLAESELSRTEKREIEFLGSSLGTIGLRAEVRFWHGDIEGALEETAKVIRVLGGWQLQTEYEVLPDDITRMTIDGAARLRAYTVRGMCLLARGRYREARHWLELAGKGSDDVARIFATYGGGFISNFPEVYYGTGMCLTALGVSLLAEDPESSRAGEILRWASDYFNAIGYAAGNVAIEAAKAQVLLDTGHPRPAEAAASKGLALAEKLELLDFIWRLEAARGEALQKMGRAKEAEISLRLAQSAVDLICGTMTTDEAKVRFGAGKEMITRYLAAIDLKKKDYETLFEDLERGRARAFVSMLARRGVGADREPRLVAEIRALDEEILKERQRKTALSSRGKTRNNLELELLEKRIRLVNALRGRDPELADAFSIASVGLDNVRGRLRPGEMMVYVIPAGESESIRLLFISGKQVFIKELSITWQGLRDRLESFHRARKEQAGRAVTLVERKAAGQRASSDEKAALDVLAKDLALSEWGSPKTVYIVPSGHFYFIPWGALDQGFPFVVLPTGGWVVRSAPVKNESTAASVVGDPEFGGRLPQLEGARKEAMTVAEQYHVRPLIGTEASESRLRASVGKGVDVLHLATHALYDSHLPLQSALILTNGRTAAPLTAERLFEKPLPARHVILSACETGMGRVAAGDDLIGLVRSFYLGGTEAILSSLWPVDDEATRLFMETYHVSLKRGNYGAAWLAARDTLKKRGLAPSLYGAFILGGSSGLTH